MTMIDYLEKRQFLAGFGDYFNEKSAKILFDRDLYTREHTDLNPIRTIRQNLS